MPREQQVEQNIEPPYVRQLSDEELEELLLPPTKTRVPSLSHAVGSTCGKATTAPRRQLPSTAPLGRTAAVSTRGGSGGTAPSKSQSASHFELRFLLLIRFKL